MNGLILLLLLLLVCAAIWTVLTPTLLHAAIALALTSAVLSLIMFEMNASMAAVFELSVCAGLITVVFISAISLTRPGTAEAERLRARTRLSRFVWLPVLLAVVTLVWSWFPPAISSTMHPGSAVASVREVLWNERRFDLLGQLLLILTGVFGVVVLFKGWDTEGKQ